MNVLAARGVATVCDVGARAWIDVDDDAAFEQAERLMASGAL